MSEAPPGQMRIWLGGVVPPTLNTTLRQHWSKRGRGTRAMAWQIRAGIKGALPAAPLPRAHVRIERRAPGTIPDQDGATGGCKGLIDCLLPMDAKRRPYGLGILRDDSPAHMTLEVRTVRVPSAEKGTLVLITPL